MKKQQMRFTKEDLKHVVNGACFFASGGGGSFESGMSLTKNFKKGGYYHTDTVDVASVASLEKNKYGVVVAYMGAPEKIKNLDYPRAAVSAFKRVIEMKKLDISQCVVVPIEIGALSSVVACLCAAKLGIPVLDADGAGRAVPTLELCTFSTNGVSINPTAITNKSSYVELNISDPTSIGAAARIESLARPIISMPEYDQAAGIALWVMPASDIKDIVIDGTLTMCRELGEYMSQKQKASASISPEDLIQAINKIRTSEDYTPAILYRGKLQDATISTSGGFDFGVVTVNSNDGRVLRIIFQNESLMLWDSRLTSPVIMAPDLISYILTPAKGKSHQLVYSNSDLFKDGQFNHALKNADIAVFGLKAPKRLFDSEQRISLHREKRMASNELLPNNYLAQLNHLGYYGKYECFLDKKKRLKDTE